MWDSYDPDFHKRSWWRDNWQYVLLITLMVLSLFGFFVWNNYQCSYRGKLMGLSAKYNIVIDSCLIQPEDGVWIPIENYRYLDND